MVLQMRTFLDFSAPGVITKYGTFRSKGIQYCLINYDNAITYHQATNMYRLIMEWFQIKPISYTVCSRKLSLTWPPHTTRPLSMKVGCDMFLLVEILSEISSIISLLHVITVSYWAFLVTGLEWHLKGKYYFIIDGMCPHRYMLWIPNDNTNC